ncbi:MAG: urea ABC transporter ATP-binding subunit UrtE [Chromatocurvus sp.]
MIRVAGLNQYYGQSHILRDVDMVADAGNCTCVLGRNGVGKTTLLKCIMGLLPLRSGSVTLDNHDITRFPPEARARAGIAYVPQGREIFSELTVEENLRVPLVARADGARQIPDISYRLFPVLKEMRRRRGGDLSGGQQQQLAIARALVLQPKVLLLDEPGEGIQPNIVRQIGDVIGELTREYGLCVVLVEQKLPFARRVANRFHIMEKGSVVAGGSVDQLSDELVASHLSV